MAEAPVVLQVHEPAYGGLPEHVRVLSQGLAAREHRMVVAGPPGAATRAALEVSPGVGFQPVEMVGTFPAGRQDAVALRRLAAVARDARVDVIHAHGQKAGLLARLVAARLRIPAVYTGHSLVYTTQLRRARRGARARYLVGRASEQGLGRLTARLVAVSRAERETALRDHLVEPSRVALIEHGVAPDLGSAPAPELLEFRQDGPLLGFVANLREQKGLPVLLDGLERLVQQGRPVRFVVVGDGPLDAEVRRRVSGGPLAAHTLVLPFGGRVEPYLAGLDGFVLPSRWEGMPIAIIEAMWFGLPVVATAVDGTPEAVADGRTGLLVALDDAAGLAEAIGRLAADPALRARLGAAASQEARRRFTVQRMLDEYERLYREVAHEALGVRGPA